MDEIHAKQTSRANRGLKRPEAFKPGDKVWYRRPENTGGPVDSRWLGPAKIVAREGQDSYVIEIKPEHLMKSHRTFLKPHFEDVYSGQPVPLFFIIEELFWKIRWNPTNLLSKNPGS